MAQKQLQISSWLPRSVAHGPGQRFVLWVQGCTLGCRDCFSLHTHDRRGGKSISVQELACIILDTRDIEGITISGGEPLLQASSLTLLTKMIQPRGLTVMCYTGFTLCELCAMHRADIDGFLESVDILIDGRFVREQAAPLRWRGSRNQQIHFLSEAYQHLEDRSDDMSRIEFLVSQSEFTTTGVWPEDFLEHVILALSGGQR